jgi:ubiquitin-conjugating enzyme E2 G2|tara:strand:+ start:41 stop:589 length:549 start_codon:yes stop_codon:yes gene_type:complete
MNQSLGRKRLELEYKQITKQPPLGMIAGLIKEDDPYKWEALMMGPDDTPFEGGCFRAILEFPRSYPMNPPTVRFTTKMWHPNIYPDGKVCISILHSPGHDPTGYDKPEELWSPLQTTEKVILSIQSMLGEPNDESPANIDAAKMWRSNRTEYEEKVKTSVRQSLGLEQAEPPVVPLLRRATT